MKIYFRILRYAPNLGLRLTQFFIYAVLAVIFNATYLGLIQPMLDVLFKQKLGQSIPPIPEFSYTIDYLKQVFNHYFIGIVNTEGPLNALMFVCLCIVIGVFLSNLFRYLERMAASIVKVDVVKNIRMDVFNKVTNMHIGYFNDQRKGDLISRFTNDVAEVEGAVVNSLKSVFKEPITLIVFIVMLFMISSQLALFTLIVLPLTGGVIAEIIKRLKKRAEQSQETMGRIVNILDEAFGGMRVIYAFNARNFLLKRIDDESTFHRKVNLSISRKNELASPLSELLGVIIVAVILYYGGRTVLSGSGELDSSSFLLFLTIYASMIQPAKNFSNGITSLQKGITSARRIFEVIDAQPAIQDKPGAVALPSFQHSIEFRHVTFGYTKEKTVLNDINVIIPKGKTIALVGPSGGGKSTLADLVPRFYDPQQGEVCIDGKPLTDYQLESIRKEMGIVTQESILFNDTIFNNIAFGLENVSEEDVIRAAKVANAHEFIVRTEDGYQTKIGERGSKLSGGQRQRLSIARAVLKNPPILILDEATSALDSESEKLVQDALTKLMENRTSIVIAHRLSTIQHADEILVIQDGKIMERGKHEQLMQQGGLYTKLTEIQKV